MEEHSILTGLGGAVAEVLPERSPTLVRRLSLRDVFGESGADGDLLEKDGLIPRHVAETAESILRLARR